jgi:hypothetical protein
VVRIGKRRPYGTTDSIRSRGTEARTRVEELEEEQRSRLDVVFRPESPFEFQKIAVNTGAVIARTFRVQIRNLGGDRLDHCSVQLVDVHGSKAPNDLPHKLKLMGDDPYDLLNTPHVQEFSLNPNEVQYVDVIHWEEAKTQKPFALCYAKRGHQKYGYDNSLPPGKYDLTLEATANHGDPIMKKFRVDVESGSMTFQTR